MIINQSVILNSYSVPIVHVLIEDRKLNSADVRTYFVDVIKYCAAVCLRAANIQFNMRKTP